jgi:toxin YoeB
MAQRKIIWSVPASQELISILDFYLIRNGNPAYSEKLLAEIDSIVSYLPEHPNLGKQTEDKIHRVLIRNNYEIFYRVEPEAIIIVTLWDSRRNPEEKPIQ